MVLILYNKIMKIALIQLNSQDDKSQNIEKVCDFVEKAVDSGAEMVFLPEVFNLRASKDESISEAEKIPDGISSQTLIELAKKYKIYINNGSIFEESANLPFNTSVTISPEGKVISKYQKIHLFDVEIAGKEIKESAKSQAGSKTEMVKIEELNFAFSICYDLRFAELYTQYAKANVDVILSPSSFTKKTGELHWEVLNRARAIESQAYIIACNQCGTASGIETYGHSMVVDPLGKVLTQASADQEEIIYAELDKALISKVRETMPMASHRRL